MTGTYKRLTAEEWGDLYSVAEIDGCMKRIESGNYLLQTKEMLTLTKPGESVIEIGSGTGETSLILAKEGRKATALDYQPRCLELTKSMGERLHVDLEYVEADAEKELVFPNTGYDVVFQAGLLEHYEPHEQVALLNTWGKICNKRMISLVPNAHALAYRIGKARMEKKGTWSYGQEIPVTTLRDEFAQAGFKVTQEYTIGAHHALNFLPRWHPLRWALKPYLPQDDAPDLFGQGYLLVTVGEKL